MPDSFWHCTYVSVGCPVSEEPTSPGFRITNIRNSLPIRLLLWLEVSRPFQNLSCLALLRNDGVEARRHTLYYGNACFSKIQKLLVEENITMLIGYKYAMTTLDQ